MDRDSESARPTQRQERGEERNDTMRSPPVIAGEDAPPAIDDRQVTMRIAPPPSDPIAAEALSAPLRRWDVSAKRYEPRERLGAGGMGEVTRTFDAKIGRDVALKTLRDQLGDDTDIQSRFLREARVQAMLEHPAILPVYDIDLGADGRPFFTMKRVQGETLADLLDALRLAGEASARATARNALLRAFVTVCLAIQYAHDRGVVHRDVKPSNIMLGAHGEVYILDWGVAKFVTAETPSASIEGSDATEPGEVFGTLGYMPPEQLLGHVDEIDARSDVYALGAILYEILTLVALHAGRDNLDVVAATLSATPKAPSIPEGAPPELFALALRAARFRREARPAAARELAEQVERYLDGDRDADLRAKLANERAREARAALDRLSTCAPEERGALRALALRHAGNALALAPGHQKAAAVVLELLARPPEEEPVEVKKEMAERDDKFALAAMRDNAFRLSSWLLAVPMAIAMGARMPRAIAGIVASMLLASGLGFYALRRRLIGRGVRLCLFAATSIVFSLFSGMFGPFIVIPAMAAVNTVIFSAQARRADRPLFIAIGIVPFVAPLLAELAGLLPPSFDFAGGVITIHPRLVWFPPGLTFLFLVIVSALNVITPTLLTGRLRDALRDAEKKLVMQKWQLAHLSPSAPSPSSPARALEPG